MAQTLLSYKDTLVVTECANCGITFAFTESFQTRRRDDHRNFYCPAGHSNVYLGKSEAEQLREQLQRMETDRDRWRAWEGKANERTKNEQRRHAATKGQLTKVKKRAANGVCPCCNRSFVQLAHHIRTQHPDFVTA